MAKPSRLIELFTQAKALPAGADRERFLSEACQGDRELKEQMTSLLQADEGAGDFLENPMPSPTVAASEKPGDTISRYKLLQQLGEGGCGLVYMAEQTEPVRRRVALKIIKLGMDTRQVIARFEAERQALALMDHPNIAKVFDAGATETGRPFFVMELVRGIKITEYCDQNELSTPERLHLFIQVCQAIQHAHQKGVIHRDIKPSNILVTQHDTVAVPKVIDFGIAKATSDQRLTDKTLFTAFEQFIGTPAYMSPEQAQMSGLDIDTRTDIYSLGVLLYELLTGKTPFDAKELIHLGIDALRKTIRERDPPRPSTRLTRELATGDVSRLKSSARSEEQDRASSRRLLQMKELVQHIRGDLDWIVMKCLEKDRTRRYETANGLVMDLQRHLQSEPVLACPPSAAYRFRKFARRHKAALATASLLVVAIVLAAAGLAVSTIRIAQEQRTTATALQAEKQQRLRADAEKTTAQRNLYVANMIMAQQAWEQSNIGRLRQLLEQTRESPHRGFEWFYWQRQCHLALKVLEGHLAGITSVAFSPDGRQVVTGSADQTAKVWDAASGRELFVLKTDSAPITSAAFSPDGQRMVIGSADQTARIWEIASGREVVTLKGHGEGRQMGVYGEGDLFVTDNFSVAFSPNGQRIATGSADQTAKVWEAGSGRELLRLKGHGAGIRSLAFSPDSLRIVTGSLDQTAKVWDAAAGHELLNLKGHNAPILSVVFSPDGKRIVTGSDDKTAKVWDAASGQELLTFRGHSDFIRSVAFSPDGQRIISGSWDRTAKLWEAVSGQELLTITGHADLIRSVAFSPDGQRIITGSEDKTARIWDAAGGGRSLTLKGHGDLIKSVAFSPDGQRMVTGSYDQTAKVWETAGGRQLLTLTGHSAPLTSVAFSPDGRRIVTGSLDQKAKVWEADTGRELLTLDRHSPGTMSVVVSRDGQPFITGNFSVAYSPDGQRIVTGSLDNTAKVWEAASGRELLTFKKHSAAIRSVAFSPDSRRIITGSEDNSAKVWEAASGRELLTLKGHLARILSVAFSLDGQRIVTGSYDQTAKVWNAATGRELLTLLGHRARLSCVTFSPDGKRIVTSSFDQTVKVWDAASGQELLGVKLKGPAGFFTFPFSVVFSPDGQRLAMGSSDHTARVWDAARPEEVTAWQVEERAAAQSLAALQRERAGEEK